MPSPASDQESPALLTGRLGRAFSHELRARILVELNKRVLCPSEFAREFPEYTLSSVSRHFRELEKLGCIEEVEQRSGGKHRGGVAHYFRATQRAMFDVSAWEKLPASIRSSFSGVIFETLIERVSEAAESGTLDAHTDRHFTWTALVFDREAWEEMVERTDALFERSLELQVEAKIRMAESGGESIPATVALACFESPKSLPASD